MNKFVKTLLVTAALGLVGTTVIAPSAYAAMAAMGTKMVGGAAMYPTKNIIENALNSKDHTTLVAAVKAAGLVDTLEGKGPFTVFAPTNEAFAALPKGTVDNLLKPENKAMLVKILTAHVLAGHYDVADLKAAAKTAGGSVAMKTVSGNSLTFMIKGSVFYVVDESGGAAKITIGDVEQSNGVIQVVNKVLLPK